MSTAVTIDAASSIESHPSVLASLFEEHAEAIPGLLLSHGDDIIPAPDVAVIGAIPLEVDAPDGDYAKHSRYSALKALFRLGNYKPPEQFGDRSTFASYLWRRREFRGAVMLSDVRIHVRKGRVIGAECVTLSSQLKVGVGHTPWNARARTVRGRPWNPGGWEIGKLVGRYDKGVGFSEMEILLHSGHVEINHLQAFRIGWIGALAAKVRFWLPNPPFMWVWVKYLIHVTGEHELSVESSLMPSFWVYRNWSRVDETDMSWLDDAQITSVLDATTVAANGGYAPGHSARQIW